MLKVNQAVKFALSAMLAMTPLAQVNADINPIEIKVIRGELSQEKSNAYFHQVLREALAHNQTGDEYELTPVDFEFSQNRTLKLLNYFNVLDITHTMTSEQREQQYTAIKVPLLNGMYGKRKFIVAKHNKNKFENISLAELKTQVACQGLHWPDFSRLKNNGYAVYGVNSFEANFKMLAKQRCDYFPRSIAEIQLDFTNFNGKYGELAIVDSVMLTYHAPVYFFVGERNKDLAKVVEYGLKKLEQSGRLKQLLLESKAFYYSPEMESLANKVFWLEEK